MPFGVIDPTNNGTPIRDHQTPKKFSIQKFVFYGQSDAEKFADFNGTIIFEIRQKLRNIVKKNLPVCLHGLCDVFRYVVYGMLNSSLFQLRFGVLRYFEVF